MREFDLLCGDGDVMVDGLRWMQTASRKLQACIIEF